MSQLHRQGQTGRLLFVAGGQADAASRPLRTITADVLHYEIDSRFPASYATPFGLVGIAPDITGTFRLGRVAMTTDDCKDAPGLWELARDDPHPPPELAALLELARRHPEEFEELREGEAVLRALGG